MGVASLILGIISLIVGFVPLCGIIALIPAIIGLILGIIDIISKNKTKEKKNQSIAGIILSAISIVFIIFWAIIVSGMDMETNSNFTNEYLENKQIEEQQKQDEELIRQKEEQKRIEEQQEQEKIQQEQQEKQRQEQEKQNIENYKASCINYNYKEIARNPNNYNGKRMKFTGEVIQVSEGWFNSVILRINVTKGEYGFYEDTIYCTYIYSENESKILKDDIVTIYGECKGEETYTSILGQNITIPKVEIKYIQIENN